MGYLAPKLWQGHQQLFHELPQALIMWLFIISPTIKSSEYPGQQHVSLEMSWMKSLLVLN